MIAYCKCGKLYEPQTIRQKVCDKCLADRILEVTMEVGAEEIRQQDTIRDPDLVRDPTCLESGEEV